MKLNEHEVEVLKMVHGVLPWERGAWVNACYEFLQDEGHIQRYRQELTEKGKKYLEDLNRKEVPAL